MFRTLTYDTKQQKIRLLYLFSRSDSYVSVQLCNIRNVLTYKDTNAAFSPETLEAASFCQVTVVLR